MGAPSFDVDESLVAWPLSVQHCRGQLLTRDPEVGSTSQCGLFKFGGGHRRAQQLELAGFWRRRKSFAELFDLRGGGRNKLAGPATIRRCPCRRASPRGGGAGTGDVIFSRRRARSGIARNVSSAAPRQRSAPRNSHAEIRNAAGSRHWRSAPQLSIKRQAKSSFMQQAPH